MKKMIKRITFGFASLAFAMTMTAIAHAKDFLVLETSQGTVEIELLKNIAPNHVARIKDLANSGFYNGLTFHRVIDGFMAQTGDPLGTGAGKSKKFNINAEFSLTPFERGVVGMARGGHRNSANSQFFIMFDEKPSLNGQYTAFGRVTKGMTAVDKIQRGDKAKNGSVPVDKRDKIIKAKVVSR